MDAGEIFTPFIGMLLLTFFVWVHLYVRRIGYMIKHRIGAQKLTTPEKGKALIPEAVNFPAYNLTNLFELPVVFYALCLYLFVTGNVDMAYVAAAWVFFLLRVSHSVVHCTFNRVIVRFWLYALSSLALWFMLFRAAIDLLSP
jgi:hypothetical protein